MLNIKFIIASFSVAMVLTACSSYYPEDDRDSVCDTRAWLCDTAIPSPTTTTRYVPPTSASICLKANSKPAPPKPKPITIKPAPIIIIPPAQTVTTTVAPTATTTQTTQTTQTATPQTSITQSRPGC